MTIIAAIQMNSGPEVNANLREAERLIAQAAETGARLVILPENFALMGYRESDKVAIRETEGDGPVQAFLAHQAAHHGIWLVGGTIPLAARQDNKIRASCLLFDDQGQRVARYDKMHLFDVDIIDSTESYRESATIEPGEQVAITDTPFGRLGLAVCYDLRFPELFRALTDQELEILALPSAFTALTGKAHWEPLLRARAIENLCYIVAAAQVGRHANDRETHGHSMIVEPWGLISAQLPQGPGVIHNTLDLDRLHTTRRLFPALQHRRLHCTL